ncbi:unnamed protein product, partial [Allacma fusca]
PQIADLDLSSQEYKAEYDAMN